MSKNGYVMTLVGRESPTSNRRHRDSAASSESVRLDGNIARRKAPGWECFYWDNELPGFGLRVFAGGAKTWFVQYRQRGRQRRVTLGHAPAMCAREARKLARAKLASVALDGLPVEPIPGIFASKDAMLFRDYAPRFWEDYSRHWKPSTCKSNRFVIFKYLVAIFGDTPVEAIRKADILRWRDSWARRSGSFNRSIPIMSVMMTYAEQLELRPRNSNPCRGTPRYKRKPMERYLSAREFARLSSILRGFEESHPIAVQAIRLLIYTGARRSEVLNLRWEWVQPPRLMLPDSKTGPKIIYLNGPARAGLVTVLRRSLESLTLDQGDR
ncbi:integrase arm-type DNA-binding domain-containing protein [Novosphingobium sp.]|uniref:tyrosine-type recombinase/integrase n=1 Tax=Novosphingobium sp. TaxID=1874826 RepID=UPI0025EE9D34|nr:integrase arm-type DNA-binding domain-containing protein [Novosphingobium sp.]